MQVDQAEPGLRTVSHVTSVTAPIPTFSESSGLELVGTAGEVSSVPGGSLLLLLQNYPAFFSSLLFGVLSLLLSMVEVGSQVRSRSALHQPWAPPNSHNRSSCRDRGPPTVPRIRVCRSLSISLVVFNDGLIRGYFVLWSISICLVVFSRGLIRG